MRELSDFENREAKWGRGAAVALSIFCFLLAAGAAFAQSSPAADAVIAFDKAGVKVSKPVRVAYLTECVQNPYCQARLKGITDAAAKFGFEFKVFDANFNPTDQLKHVQNAAAENFDGYILAPTAAAPACSMWKQFLVPTGAPVVTVDLPMCGDADYTPGLAGTVTMQRQAYFNAMVDRAFASCQGPCKLAAVGGFVGSDLFNLWENAIKSAGAKYPNVSIVADQPGNYDPRVTLRIVQDALRAHPDLGLVISPWDDMTRGADQAITSVGKKPGSDVRIYSIGGTKDAVAHIKDGSYNETTVLLPWEEAYYGGVALIMAIEGKPLNAYVNEALLPAVTQGPGTIFITKENVDKFKPNY